MHSYFKISIIPLFSLFISVTSQASVIDTADRFWSFDETFSDSINDVVANDIGGIGFGEDRDGNANGALSLDGYDDKVLISSTSDLGLIQDFTLSFWFMNTSDQANRRTYLFDTRGPDAEVYNATLIYFDSQSNSETANLRVANKFIDNVTITQNEWHHIAFVNSVTDSFATAYFDGEVIASNASVLSLNLNFDRGLVFGSAASSNIGGAYWLKGAIDDAALWSDALTAEDIEELYTMQASATVSEPYTLSLFLVALMGLTYRNRKHS